MSRVLIACECSGRVRTAFRALGHDAWSCDLEAAEDGSPFHIRGDVLEVFYRTWDCIIGFPPCTDLCVSGARWFKEKQHDGRQQRGIDFFMAMVNAPARFIAVENPVGIMSTRYRKPDQIVQPSDFGHHERKATCLWLKGLPPLKPTQRIPKEKCRQSCWLAAPGPNRARDRARTYQGIANAMAAQWAPIIEQGEEK